MTRRSNAISGYGKSLLQPYLLADSLRWHTVKRQLEALLNIKHYLSKQIKPEKVNLEMGNQQSSHLLSLGLRTCREATWRKYR
ncbi:hypothetical protein HRG_013451 [Hirsutella rhossiliensis]